MFRRIFDRNKLEVSLVACGDTGLEIAAEMITGLKRHGAIVKSLAITSELESHHAKGIFSQIVIIDDKGDGFAKKLELGVQAAEKYQKQIDDKLSKVIPQEKEGLMLIITGAGATGLGGATVVTDILYNKHRKVPPIVTLLPEAFESSRAQYNISTFLYNVAFKNSSMGNSILLIDNKPSLKEMNKPFSQVCKNRIETVPNAFADMLFASFEDSVSEEFDAKTNDLFEVLHTPGISVFIAEDLSGDGVDSTDSTRISDVVSESVIASTSLSRDQVFDAKNAFITLLNIENRQKELGFQTIIEARKFSKSFQETTPFIKFVTPDDDRYGRSAKMRGIVSGLPLPNRILQIMSLARSARKRIIVEENQLNGDVIPFKIDEVEILENRLKNLDE